MEPKSFDALTKALGQSSSRRALLPWLGGLLAAVQSGAGRLQAKKKKKKKKVTLCLDGQTITAPKKKKKKLLKSGATPGACPQAVCTPTCPGTACGGDDGCGGICGCAAGSLCHAGFCRTCTVTCNGDGGTCGNLLQTELTKGGRVYVCAGRYAGNFTLSANVELVGAGDGEDPASNTVLDGNLNGGVMTVAPGVVAELHRLRITGGIATNDAGGGIYNDGSVAMTACTLSKNTASFGGGAIMHSLNATGPLSLKDCTVKDNIGDSGGGLAIVSGYPVTIANCVVSGNRANDEGGAIVVRNGTVTIEGSTITGNTALSGGGIFNNDSVTVTSTTFSANSPNNCAGLPVTGCTG